MHFLWHIELQPDYRYFFRTPENCKAKLPEWLPSRFDRLGDQVKEWELWQRKQNQPIELHTYLSHFPGFHAPPKEIISTAPDFFDFRINILSRRHQSFIEYRSAEEPIILLSPGVLFSQNLDIFPAIETARKSGRLVSVRPADAPGLLSGFWVIPPNIQEEFCRPIPPEIAEKCAGDDLGYWYKLASQSEPIVLESDAVTNILPDYSDTKIMPEIGGNAASPLTQSENIAWSKDDFTAWMSRQEYRIASTMRWCPHEYILINDKYIREPSGKLTKRLRPLPEQIEYLSAIDFLYRTGRVDQWKSRYQLAGFVDEYKYWNCGTIDLVNRTSNEFTERIFAEDGKDRFGRPIQKP